MIGKWLLYSPAGGKSLVICLIVCYDKKVEYDIYCFFFFLVRWGSEELRRGHNPRPFEPDLEKLYAGLIAGSRGRRRA